ncbi:MAG: uroporphyrinogen-III synthase [Gemmatimonadetes bacterium]|nr:uroporphyrinogen-III synthase [Gemmatimonadota bacterium]NNM04226.1 uroporphyrinogen-III synthase [Gemmatimonadota bacterium]
MSRDVPLAGIGVAVTRGEGPNGPLSSLLESRGARVLDWGCVAFAPPEDICPLLASLARIRDYDWICFSSPRAVEAVVRRLPEPVDEVRVAAVGPATAAALEEAGWGIHRVPKTGTGEGLVEEFRKAGDASGARVFFPSSAIARDVIPDGLEELGAEVDRTTAYRMITLPVDGSACREALEAGTVQVVTFASPSAMRGLQSGIGEGLFLELAVSLPAAAMGPTTADALRAEGWKKISVATQPTFAGLADAAAEAVELGLADRRRGE